MLKIFYLQQGVDLIYQKKIHNYKHLYGLLNDDIQ